MYSKKVTVHNRIGIKGMACIITVKCCNIFKSRIWMEFDNNKVNAKSLNGVKSLKISQNDTFILSASGEDEKESVDSIAKLIQSGFSFSEKQEFYKMYNVHIT